MDGASNEWYVPLSTDIDSHILASYAKLSVVVRCRSEGESRFDLARPQNPPSTCLLHNLPTRIQRPNLSTSSMEAVANMTDDRDCSIKVPPEVHRCSSLE
jgi:hypothetical protein